MDFHDPVSSLTHLGTAVWAGFATLILVRLTRGHGPGRWAVGGYGLSMVLLYAASGLFHGVRHPDPASFRFYQKLDKSAIFLLIAGSHLPIFVYLLDGGWRRWCLAAAGAVVAAGVGMVWAWPDHPHPLLVGVYVGVALVGLVPIRKYVARIGLRGVRWVAAFAAAYLAGAAVEVAEWPVLVPGLVGPHEVMHVADMAGTFLHFGFVVTVVIRRRPGGVRPPPRPAAGAVVGPLEYLPPRHRTAAANLPAGRAV